MNQDDTNNKKRNRGDEHFHVHSPEEHPDHRPIGKVKRILFGAPRDLLDRSIFHRISLIPFLAWIGLGADGLSSSAYGPEEAFRTLGEHKYLALGLAALTAITVFVISAAYKRIIEAFPQGGGGYVVASKLLGSKAGLVSGCALVIDYVLTVTVSIAAAGDALFSFVPIEIHGLKLPFEITVIVFLSTLNIRGVRESVLVLAPVFVGFLITHAIAIGWGIIGHLPEIPATVHSVRQGFETGTQTLGPWALFLLFIHAYSLGGGTYTGIEAVSTGVPIMREPRVENAKKTMNYMAISLAVTAAGLLLCYLLWGVSPVPGKTLNAVLLEQITGNETALAKTFVISALICEGFLLVAAAQAGFIGGPRVLANMANDSWVPRRFSALSERLTTGNGVLLMGGASLAALIYTSGHVSMLVVMYSINVFLTFSLSILGMLVSYLKKRQGKAQWWSGVITFSVGFVLCALILVITVIEKFQFGGWLTLLATSLLVILCVQIKSHYLQVAKNLSKLYSKLERAHSKPPANPLAVDPKLRTAVILVGGYGGLGIHTFQSILKSFPGLYKNFVFVSIGVVDSGGFKGEQAIEELKLNTQAMLERYASMAQNAGVAATYRMSLGTDVVHEGELLCQEVAQEFALNTFFTGKIIFEEEKWFQRFLHNETALALQKRLQLAGHTMVVLPAKVG